MLTASINSVEFLRMKVRKYNLSNIIPVASFGFFSSRNIKELDDIDILYIIPLELNSRIIPYSTGCTDTLIAQ